MKLIHIRIYPREISVVRPATEKDAEEIIAWERECRDKVVNELTMAGLEPLKDYVIFVSHGYYTGQGNYKEMEIEVFDI